MKLWQKRHTCSRHARGLLLAWARWPQRKPIIPADEDEELHARRLVAQRCIYGVDKNPLATDLAKLSLWLATLARDTALRERMGKASSELARDFSIDQMVDQTAALYAQVVSGTWKGGSSLDMKLATLR